MKNYFFSYLVFTFTLYLLFSPTNVLAQQTATPDELFIQAKTAATEKTGYPAAIELLKKALDKSPNYNDIRIYLGRLYAFSGKLDSARAEFNYILTKNPKYFDALAASYDLEYWNGNYDNALIKAEKIISYHPDSVSFSINKARILVALKKPVEAISFLENMPPKYKNNKDIVNYLTEIKESNRESAIKSADDLFAEAITEVRANKNYQKAIAFLKQGIIQSPNYNDLRIYLGKIYTWTDKLDSARFQFNQVLARNPKSTDAIDGNFDLEYWNDNLSKAMDFANKGYLYYPDSANYVIKKAKVYNAMDQLAESYSLLKSHIKSHPKQTEVINYLDTLKQNNPKNIISLSYEYVGFDKRFDQPWQYASIDYTHKFDFSSVNISYNYAHRFGLDGSQLELSAYPSIAKGISAYVGTAYSNSNIYMRFRIGTSIYYTLPKSFDAETGFRYLDFISSKTYIYVLGLGKYWRNYYFTAKTFLSPNSDGLSSSLTLSARYYLDDRNFMGISAGTGISPDDISRNIIGTSNHLKRYNIGLTYTNDIYKNINILLGTGWTYENYRADTWGSQYSANISLSKRF